ncbi:hypothetical protein DFH07DRAFT_853329 [Mycena maculata]|uniref:Ribosomal protein/NADH dehydrogenase domain-containing protein n=1 Tax=Mycena maculata TaxID=230809 RepID=A0AAD7MNW4_9AGAR|nr:hypothetical protein DFH07DRAFT_853329 [Mycena maculata]
MARGKRLVDTGPSRLAQLVAHLRAPPKLILPSITALRITLAARNDHFGARHFLKEQLPRIRFANPNLEINVRKMTKKPRDDWRPELQISFRDGKTETLNLHGKWSTAIVRELMENAGSAAWVRWKAEAARAGLPLVPGEEHEKSELPPMEGEQVKAEPRWSFDEWVKSHRRRVRKSREEGKAGAGQTKKKKEVKGKGKEKEKEEKEVKAKDVVDQGKAKEEEARKKAAKKEAKRARLDAPRLAEEEAEKKVALELLAKPRTGAAAVLP